MLCHQNTEQMLRGRYLLNEVQWLSTKKIWHGELNLSKNIELSLNNMEQRNWRLQLACLLTWTPQHRWMLWSAFTSWPTTALQFVDRWTLCWRAVSGSLVVKPSPNDLLPFMCSVLTSKSRVSFPTGTALMFILSLPLPPLPPSLPPTVLSALW